MCPLLIHRYAQRETGAQVRFRNAERNDAAARGLNVKLCFPLRSEKSPPAIIYRRNPGFIELNTIP